MKGKSSFITFLVLFLFSASVICAETTGQVTDPEAFKAQEGGLWFDFIDPSATGAVPGEQLVADGLSGMSGADRTDGLYSDADEVGTAYRQYGSIDLNTLGKPYTIRACNCWDKARYETAQFGR